MEQFKLKDKTILVTGASSGIGRFAATLFSQFGAKLVITGRNSEELALTFSKLNGTNHQQLIADLTKNEDVEFFTKNISAVDGIFHCAGIVKPYPVKFISEAVLKEVYQINLNAQILLMTGLFKNKKINKGASIVFSSSIAANHPYKGGALYSSSKAALETYSKVIALEFSSLGIRSNCIASAMVKTPMYDTAEHQGTKERMDEHIKKYPLGVGYPEDVANAAIFLLSDASRWMTGQTITLDGGFLLGDF